MRSLDVSLDKSGYLPGERVRAVVRVQADTDLAIREGLAQLQYRNRYPFRDTNFVDYGPTWHSVVVATQRFEGEETIPAGLVREWTVSLAVPDQGPPTASLESTEIAWQATVKVDVRGRDVRSDTDFWVYAPLSAATRGQTPAQPTKLEAEKCAFELRLPSRSFLAGEEIKGSLVITAHKSMRASQVLVNLVRRTEFHDRAANARPEVAVVDGGDLTYGLSLHLAAGESREFSINLQLPRDACPSFRAEKSTVCWGIECAAPHWLSRPSGTLPIEVYNLSVP